MKHPILSMSIAPVKHSDYCFLYASCPVRGKEMICIEFLTEHWQDVDVNKSLKLLVYPEPSELHTTVPVECTTGAGWMQFNGEAGGLFGLFWQEHNLPLGTVYAALLDENGNAYKPKEIDNQ